MINIKNKFDAKTKPFSLYYFFLIEDNASFIAAGRQLYYA